MNQPAIVEELPSSLDAEDAFARLSALPYCIFLDSALRDARLGRYSFVAADPFDFYVVPTGATASLARLRKRIGAYAASSFPDLPPFQGGAAGLLGYEMGRELESIPHVVNDEFSVPVIAVGFYDVVLAFDHVLDRVWCISQGFPETDAHARRARSAERLSWIKQLVLDRRTAPVSAQGPPKQTTPKEITSPHCQVQSSGELFSNFTEAGYYDAVRRCIDYIYAGDVFQVNLSQRLLSRAKTDAVTLYRRLRSCNPATFAGYFDIGEHQILSASPERFLRLRDGVAEARPIKGTRKRTAKPEADLFAGDELKSSEKDRAENVMIVDLMRNDLSRVCDPDSVAVTQLCELEQYQFVQHLVSAIQGRLQAGCDGLHLLEAAFPGGSITGAPKVRAMEIIAELEQVARGAYCGSLGYLGFDGTMDWSILIRTITSAGGWWQFPVGGGIVAQSDPEGEYEETWHKAAGLIRAIT